MSGISDALASLANNAPTMPQPASPVSGAVAGGEPSTVSTPTEMDAMMHSMGVDPSQIIVNHPVNIPLPMPGPQIRPQMGMPAMGATKNETQRNSAFALATNIASMVRAHSENKEANKLRVLQFDLERLMTAMQHPDIKENQDTINAILSDPKRAKEISKAFDIDLFGPDSSKESGALAAAMHKINGAASAAQPGGIGTPPFLPPTDPGMGGGKMPIPMPAGVNPNGGQPVAGAAPAGAAAPNTGPAGAVTPAMMQAIRSRLGMPMAPELNPKLQALQELIKNDVLPGASDKAKVLAAQIAAQGHVQGEQVKGQYAIQKEDVVAATKLEQIARQNLGNQRVAEIAAHARETAAAITAHAGISRENIRFQNKLKELIARGVVIQDMNGKLGPGPNAAPAGGKTQDYRRQLLNDQIKGLDEAIKMNDKELENFDANNPTVWDMRGTMTGGALHNPAAVERQRKLDNLKKLKEALIAQRNTAMANQQKLLKEADKGGGKAGSAGMGDTTPDDLVNDYNPDDEEQ